MRRRFITYTVLTALLLTAAVAVCIIRWDAWFSNPAEDTYFVTAEPDNIIVGFGSNYLSRTISWRSSEDKSSFAVVDGDTLPATGTEVISRSGEAVYYRVEKDSLEPGFHSYFVQTGDFRSYDYTFYVADGEVSRLFVFGDIQEKDTVSAFSQFCDSVVYTLFDSISIPAMFAYAGDVIDRPTDYAWETWFGSLHGLQTFLPQLAAVGNHEYLKGLKPSCDPRWKYIFSYPDNSAERFRGTTGYIDYPAFRLIVINTQDLFWLSDYMIMQTWLNKALLETGNKFSIVLMHHSIYSAAMNRGHPLVYATLHRTLQKADLVVAGHDHLYTRRANTKTYLLEDSVSYSAPVFIVTTSATKQYLPKCSPKDQRIGSANTFFEDICVSDDTMRVVTRLMTTGECYDEFVIIRDERNVIISDSLPAETIVLPERYKGQNNIYIRRFINRRNTRFQVF